MITAKLIQTVDLTRRPALLQELKDQNMTFENLNETHAVRELTPEELAMLAQKDPSLATVTVTTDEETDEAPAPTVH